MLQHSTQRSTSALLRPHVVLCHLGVLLACAAQHATALFSQRSSLTQQAADHFVGLVRASLLGAGLETVLQHAPANLMLS
jgi:hypothetical protein